MSGYYTTLLDSTFLIMIFDSKIYITDFHNVHGITLSASKFDVEDYTLHVMNFMRHLDPKPHVIAVWQSVPLFLAATAYLVVGSLAAQPRGLTLISGTVVPDATPSDVIGFVRRDTIDFFRRVT